MLHSTAQLSYRNQAAWYQSHSQWLLSPMESLAQWIWGHRVSRLPFVDSGTLEQILLLLPYLPLCRSLKGSPVWCLRLFWLHSELPGDLRDLSLVKKSSSGLLWDTQAGNQLILELRIHSYGTTKPQEAQPIQFLEFHLCVVSDWSRLSETYHWR